MKIVLLSDDGLKTGTQYNIKINMDTFQSLGMLPDCFCFSIIDKVFGKINITLKIKSNKGAVAFVKNDNIIHNGIVTFTCLEKKMIIKKFTQTP